jgi:hypothetical protein
MNATEETTDDFFCLQPQLRTIRVFPSLRVLSGIERTGPPGGGRPAAGTRREGDGAR